MAAVSETTVHLHPTLGPALRLAATDGAEAVVLLHGGHVISWKPAGAREQLYLSPRAVGGDGQAVRGGVPIIFPQFDRRGPEAPLPRHGFARTRRFQLSEQASNAPGRATLVLRDDELTRATWPRRFELALTL